MKKNILLPLSLLFTLFCALPAGAAEKLSGIPIGTRPDRASAAFDGNFSSYYITTQGSYSWVGLDLGTKHVISSVGVSPATGNDRALLLGMFMGANNEDLSDAVPIAIVDNLNKYEYSVNCSRGFRYVYYVGPADSYCMLSELEFYGTPGEGDDSALWQITNIPTVVVNTVNGEIPYDKEHDISSTVIIISEEGTDILEKSNTSIRERGNASRNFPKKPWRIKFEKKQNVLDAPAKAKKWTLINNYGDKTLMRNMLAFDIAKKMNMEWVPFCTPVDVVLNGEYKGCYQLCDQVEVNEGRLDIEEMTPQDVEGEALTGGYFVEVDAYAYEEKEWFETPHYFLPVTIKSPDEDEITAPQREYIRNYFTVLEPLMKDTDPLTGYRSMFDNESFIKHMLVNEMAGNTDTYWSTYMYKRRNDPKIYTGPVWDFDLGFNNDNRTYPVPSRSGNGFLWDTGLGSAAGNMRYFAQRILLKDPGTADEILDVWREARRNGLSAEWLCDKVDEYAELIDGSQRLNFMRWPVLDVVVHQNPVARGSFQAECNAVKDYCRQQVAHLDKVVGYDPDSDEFMTSINGVTDDSLSNDGNLAPVYYTLTGLRVAHPTAPGIYILKLGKTTRKILIP